MPSPRRRVRATRHSSPSSSSSRPTCTSTSTSRTTSSFRARSIAKRGRGRGRRWERSVSTTAVAGRDAEGRTLYAAAATLAGRGAPRTPLHLRPLAIPNEHGGWGFLFEPIVLAGLAAPSLGGALVAIAAVAAFLARHPLKLAAGDVVRGRRYPRTIV